MLLGSFVYSLFSGTFHIESFTTKQDLVNHLIGGILMGVGGVLSVGCTIGQGITGFSTLAVGSVITLFFIINGSILTLKMQYNMLEEPGFFRALGKSLKGFYRSIE